MLILTQGMTSSNHMYAVPSVKEFMQWQLFLLEHHIDAKKKVKLVQNLASRLFFGRWCCCTEYGRLYCDSAFIDEKPRICGTHISLDCMVRCITVIIYPSAGFILYIIIWSKKLKIYDLWSSRFMQCLSDGINLSIIIFPSDSCMSSVLIGTINQKDTMY